MREVYSAQAIIETPKESRSKFKFVVAAGKFKLFSEGMLSHTILGFCRQPKPKMAIRSMV